MNAPVSPTEINAALDTLEVVARDHALPWRPAWRGPLTRLLSWLARFSARTNLVGDHRPLAVIEEHVIETLAVAAAVARTGVAPKRIVDVGAGAGLEGLVLALWAEGAQLVAVEPRRKRADFIELVADAMGLGRRVSVVRAQVPAWQPAAPFDLATSRATFAPAQWRAHGRALVGDEGVVVVHAAVAAADGSRQLSASTSGARVELAVPGRPRHCVQVFG